MERPRFPNTRYQALDAWRGIVCLIVVLEHAGVALWPVAGPENDLDGLIRNGIVKILSLNVGAPLFFVISGFCIASSLDSSRRKGTSPSRFLARRLWRIFPPYWASVLLIALLVLRLDGLGLEWLHHNTAGLELASPASLGRAQWVGNLTLTETWRPLLCEPDSLLLNRVAWALCYQEQFYLIGFLALIVAPRRLYGALAVASLAIVSFRVAMWDSGSLFRFFGLFPDLWHEFAVGLALYWRLNVASTRASKRAVDLGVAGLLAIGWFSGLVSTAAASAFGLLLIVAYRWDDRIARVGQLDGLRACGRRSYSIYLIHLPVCTLGNGALAAAGVSGFWSRALVMIPVVTAASVAVGWVFYDLVDRRFTSLPRFGKPAPDPDSMLEAAPAGVEAHVSLVARSWTS
jgi:peptidoglycan/LPS O-acetylase OafA/YrhL